MKIKSVPGEKETDSPPAKEISRKNVKYIKKERIRLASVQFPFFSAVACLVPFINAHMVDMGLNSADSSLITLISGLISFTAAILLPLFAHRFNIFTPLLTFTFLLASFSATSLLFIPRIIRTSHQPEVFFDCTSSELLFEQCPSWRDTCETHVRNWSAGNFTLFELYRCRQECPLSSIPSTPSLELSSQETRINEPIKVCFNSLAGNEICLTDNRTQNNDYRINRQKSEPTKPDQVSPLVSFDSHLDRWILTGNDDTDDSVGSSKFDPTLTTGRLFCRFLLTEAVIVKGQMYQSVSCSPSISQCSTVCRARIRQRTALGLLTPAPCERTSGHVGITFTAYLIVRSVLDWSVLGSFALLEGLALTLTNRYDRFYGSRSRILTLVVPFLIFPPLTGYIIDLFSGERRFGDYSPAVVILDGLLLIAAIVVNCFPPKPLLSRKFFLYSSNTALADPSNGVGEESNSSRIEILKRFIGVSFLLILCLALGISYSILDLNLAPYLIEMGVSRLIYGVKIGTAFACFVPFMLLSSGLTSGIGRLHLVLIGLVFYAIRLAGMSLVGNATALGSNFGIWAFTALGCMSLGVSWIGVTSFGHQILGTASSLCHVVVHGLWIGVHFGVGRFFSALLWFLWSDLWSRHDDHWLWNWLTIENRGVEVVSPARPLGLSFRIFLRIGAIAALVMALVALVLYRCACLVNRPRKPNKKSKKSDDNQTVLTNGVGYKRLATVENQPTANGSANVKIKSNAKKNGDLSGIKMIDADDGL